MPLFDESFPVAEDWDYLIRAAATCQIAWVSEPLILAHREGSDHLATDNPKAVLLGRRRLFDKYSVELAARPKVRSRLHHKTAMTAYQAGDMRALRGHLLSAIRAYPISLRLYPKLVLASLGPLVFRSAVNMIRRIRARFSR